MINDNKPKCVICTACGSDNPNYNRIINGAYYSYLCIECGCYFKILQEYADGV